MPKLIDIKDTAKIVLVGGTICAGKDTVGKIVSKKLKGNDYSSEFISMSGCLRFVSGLGEDSPREDYNALFKGKENAPWLAEAITKVREMEEEGITVISGLRRTCDAEYFHTTFPNSYFISILADNGTLVQRIVARNRQMDFPPGTPEGQKPDIARKLLADEERNYGIMAMLGYIAGEVPRSNTYLIENGKETDMVGLEMSIYKALIHFKII